MTKHSLILFFALIAFYGNCQTDSVASHVNIVHDSLLESTITEKEPYHIIPVVGLAYQGNMYGEIGIMHPYVWAGSCTGLMGLRGYKLATEFNFNSSHPSIAPKFSMEYDLVVFCARANIIDFTDLCHNDIRFTPEFGLTAVGVVTACAGLNIPVTNHFSNNVPLIRFSVNINIIKEVFE